MLTNTMDFPVYTPNTTQHKQTNRTYKVNMFTLTLLSSYQHSLVLFTTQGGLQSPCSDLYRSKYSSYL